MDPSDAPFGIFLSASYGDVWVYTVGMVTVALGLIVLVMLAVAGVLLFGEDY